ICAASDTGDNQRERDGHGRAGPTYEGEAGAGENQAESLSQNAPAISGLTPAVSQPPAAQNADEAGRLKIEGRGPTGLCQAHVKLFVEIERKPRIDDPPPD